MNIVTIVMSLFVLLEISNVLTLYLKPGSQVGNGVGVFNAWEDSKENEDTHDLIKYLVYWVAGSKLIFIALVIIIIIMGSFTMQLVSLAALIISVLSFYWKLYPLIRRIDKNNQLTPAGYSKTLGRMIAGFITFFVIALVGGLMK